MSSPGEPFSPEANDLDLIRIYRERPDDRSFDAVLMFGPADAMIARVGGGARMIYLDPPFGTGKTFFLSPYHAPGEGLDIEHRVAYDDPVVPDDEFSRDFRHLIDATSRALTGNGVVVVHLDTNRSADARRELDEVFGRACFWGEWVVRAGVSRDGLIPHRTTSLTPTHNTLQIVGRRPVGEADLSPEQWATLANSLWTDLDTRGHESGYPSEKSSDFANRLLGTLTDPGDLILEGFAGSAAVSIAALRCGRRAMMADLSPQAICIAWARLLGWARQSGGNIAMAIAPGMDRGALVTRLDSLGSLQGLAGSIATATADAGGAAAIFLQDQDATLRPFAPGDPIPESAIAAEIVTDRSQIVRVEVGSAK